MIFASKDTQITMMKYQTKVALTTATDEELSEIIKHTVRYDTTRLLITTAAPKYAIRPMTDVTNHVISPDKPPSKYNEKPANGRMASPVPINAMAAGCSRWTFLYRNMPAP